MKLWTILCIFLNVAVYPLGAAERMSVKIVDRRDSESSYVYRVPGYVQGSSNTDVNCSAYGNSANCSATTSSTKVITPALQGYYSVRGATFSLLLPDGRIAVVNCSSKTNLTEWSMNARRNCRMPIVRDVEVEFNKDSAKLIWPVSIDGKKTESETYKIIGILDKR